MVEDGTEHVGASKTRQRKRQAGLDGLYYVGEFRWDEPEKSILEEVEAEGCRDAEVQSGERRSNAV